MKSKITINKYKGKITDLGSASYEQAGERLIFCYSYIQIEDGQLLKNISVDYCLKNKLDSIIESKSPVDLSIMTVTMGLKDLDGSTLLNIGVDEKNYYGGLIEGAPATKAIKGLKLQKSLHTAMMLFFIFATTCLVIFIITIFFVPKILGAVFDAYLARKVVDGSIEITKEMLNFSKTLPNMVCLAY